MQTNQDLFKEAIAEAKAIREVALANAKESVSESITPHLKDLLAAKLEEMEASDDEYTEELEEESVEEEEVVAEEEPTEDDAEESEDDVEDKEEEDKEEEDKEEEEGEHEEDTDVEDMSVEDLKALIRDIIAQEAPSVEDTPDMEEIPADDMIGPEAPEAEMGDEEEIDLSELMKQLEELASEETPTQVEAVEQVAEKVSVQDHEAVKQELSQALETLKSVQMELAEVNLLNSKLLYVNKIMKAVNLTEEEKANIIVTFDKAESVKEAKLVYETLVQSLSSKSKKETIKEQRSFASTPIGKSTRPSQPVIPEVDERIERMKRLAGIK